MLGVMRYGEEHGPLAIAHRGGLALGPENTLATFARATALGVRYLEADVHTTSDGVLVCFHDATLERVTGQPGSVADHTVQSLRRLRVDGREQIPTLAEAMLSFPDTRFAIDLKDEPAGAALVALLQANPAWAKRICIAGAWSNRLHRVQHAVPDVTTALGWRALTTLHRCLALLRPAARPGCVGDVRPRPAPAGPGADLRRTGRSSRPRPRHPRRRLDRERPADHAHPARCRRRRDHH